MLHRRLVLAQVALVAGCAVIVAPSRAPAQGRPRPDTKLDAATRKQVVTGTADALEARYVFPELGTRMAEALRAHDADGAYDTITSSRTLSETLTTELQAICHDKHVHVQYVAETMPVDFGKPTAREQARERVFAERVNYGFEKVERLQGNIGYLRIDGFKPAALAGETVAAAMTFVASTDALIIDLRDNGGGHPETVALVASYLFGDEPVHLNDIYDRPTNTTQQFWTHAWVSGRRFGASKPVYVLTSADTFSAAEELAYDLVNLKRATVVGEVTRGGANPGDEIRITDHLGVFVPTGRAINPITNTNWDGTGIVPDVPATASGALDVAYVAALEAVIASEKDAERKVDLEEVLATAKQKPASPAVTSHCP